MKFNTYTPAQLLEYVKNEEAQSVWILETGHDGKDDVLYDDLPSDVDTILASSRQEVVNKICYEHEIERFPEHWELKSVENPEHFLEKEIVEASLSSKMLEDYLTAEWGWDLRVWSDGSYDLEQYNTSAESEIKYGDYWPYVISRIKCPGIGELGEEQFTGQFCEYDENKGTYVELETGREIGDFAAVIHECIRDGDVLSLTDNLRDSLLSLDEAILDTYEAEKRIFQPSIN